MKNSLRKIFSAMILVVSLFVLTACKKPVTNTLVVNVGPNPATIDPALNSAVDGATMIIHSFTGLVGYQQNESGVLVLVPELATALPEPTVLTGGKVQYVFTLKDNLKWSDGTSLDASDFEYSWKRAASSALGADYSYMFDVIDGYGTTNKDDLNVKASLDGKQLTVVLNSDVPYFFELVAFPTYMPVNKDVVEAQPEKWATTVSTFIGNGPYKMTEWVVDSKIVFEKNPYYHNANAIKIPKIEFALSDDDGAILANYKNGTYKFIDTVPNDEIEALKAEYESEFVIAGQLGTYYAIFNVNDPTVYGNIATTEQQKTDVRKALSLIIDRNYIAKSIGKAGQVPANSYVPIGLTEPDGKTEFVKKNGVDGDGTGYYSVEDTAAAYKANCDEAVRLLRAVGYSYNETTKKFTNFPAFDYIHNPGSGHEAIASYLKAAFEGYGITLKIQKQEWNVFLQTRKDGNYTLARNGWLGDYNDPISFLDMWTSESGNNDAQFGKDGHKNVAIYGENHDKTWAQTYDVLIKQVKASSNPVERFALMHQAENLLMSTGAIVPIYFYTDLFMVSPELDGFFASPLGYKFFMYATYNPAK
jgi:oligopeptide transport system substrate-binding protein